MRMQLEIDELNETETRALYDDELQSVNCVAQNGFSE